MDNLWQFVFRKNNLCGICAICVSLSCFHGGIIVISRNKKYSVFIAQLGRDHKRVFHYTKMRQEKSSGSILRRRSSWARLRDCNRLTALSTRSEGLLTINVSFVYVITTLSKVICAAKLQLIFLTSKDFVNLFFEGNYSANLYITSIITNCDKVISLIVINTFH